jgi:hypothetical protein
MSSTAVEMAACREHLCHQLVEQLFFAGKVRDLAIEAASAAV